MVQNKRKIIIFIVSLFLIFGTFQIFTVNRAETHIKSQAQDGDIIFQTSNSGQSKAIQLATNSKYSHMGIIYNIRGNPFVYEAVQPVKFTKLDKWIKRGKNGKFVIKRLKNSKKILTPATIVKMKKIGKSFKGKNYDLYFEWSDKKIYCSELVWKIYKRGAGIEIGKLEKLSEFNLKEKIVSQKLKERYGKNIPLNEKVISPGAMFNSEKIITVLKN